MKRLILLILISLLSSTLIAQEKRFIAVLPLEHAGLSLDDANILTDRLGYELFKTDKYTVLERDKIEEIIAEQSFQMSGCTSTECLVEAISVTKRAHIVGLQFDNHAATPVNVTKWLEEDSEWLSHSPSLNPSKVLTDATQLERQAGEQSHEGGALPGYVATNVTNIIRTGDDGFR